MRRLPTIIMSALLALSLGGCTLFPSAMRGTERLAVVQVLGVDREGSGVRLSLVPSSSSARRARAATSGTCCAMSAARGSCARTCRC